LIQSFRSKALEQFFAGKPKLIEASFRRKVGNILFTLAAAKDIKGMDLPGYGLHEFRGDLAGTWAVVVNKNSRIRFRLENGNALDVNFVDYH
jgi:proteic killer suppression protein